MKYIKFYKPYKVLSKFTDREGRTTLNSFISLKDVYPAGRLDYRSEGLMVLTNDGSLIKILTDPRFEHPKTYMVQVEGIPPKEALDRLRNQIVLPGVQTKLPQLVKSITAPDLPSRSEPIRAYHPTSWLKITLREGKKHQVRRMTAAVGYPTLRLLRVEIGPISLGNLKPGEWQYLSKAEMRVLGSWK